MSFSQWTIAKAADNVTVALDTTTVIEGTSSLIVDTRTANRGAIAGLTSGAAVTTGRIRTIARTTNLSSNVVWGAAFGMMQSSIALTSQAYWAFFRANSSSVFLGKDQLSGLHSSSIASAAHGLTLAVDTNFTIELKFQRDTDSGFVNLTVSVGTALDFSDLSAKITHVDSSSPLSSGVSMGVGYRQAGFTGTQIGHYDKTQLFRV